MVRSASLQTQSWTQTWEQQKFFRLALVFSNLPFLKVMWPISRFWTQNPRPGRNHRSHLLCSLDIPARWSSSFRSQWRCQHLPSLRSIHYWKGFLLDDLNPVFLWLWPLVLLMPSSCTWLHATSLFNISELCHLGHTQSPLLSLLDTHRTWLSEPTLFCLLRLGGSCVCRTLAWTCGVTVSPVCSLRVGELFEELQHNAYLTG